MTIIINIKYIFIIRVILPINCKIPWTIFPPKSEKRWFWNPLRHSSAVAMVIRFPSRSLSDQIFSLVFDYSAMASLRSFISLFNSVSITNLNPIVRIARFNSWHCNFHSKVNSFDFIKTESSELGFTRNPNWIPKQWKWKCHFWFMWFFFWCSRRKGVFHWKRSVRRCFRSSTSLKISTWLPPKLNHFVITYYYKMIFYNFVDWFYAVVDFAI